MSTFIQAKPETKRIRSTADLHGYFQRFAKPKGEERVGIECELFGVFADTGEAIPYSGSSGVEQILKELAYEFGYEPIKESDHIVALKRGETFISLEPGGQVELSAAPVGNLHEAKAQLEEFFFELRTVTPFVGPIAWLATGIHPYSKHEDIEWVPKERYDIMGRYLGHQGKRAHDMMLRTATNQINFDYHNEEDAICKMRLSLAITPIAAAMFSNSALSGGVASGFQSERLNIWRYTDPDRCGLILKLICQNCSFNDYLNYVLDIPMMFVVRGGKWMVTRNLTFREFIEKGFQGTHPTQTDFELHLSTIFTDVRFKQYLEIRGMDGQRSHLIGSVYAFWKGILYSEEARKQACQLIGKFKEREIMKLHHAVERDGLKAKIRGKRVLDLARELVRISERGLEAQACLNEDRLDERIYLEPLKEFVLKTGQTPADQLLALWRGQFHKDPQQVIDYMRI